MECSHQLCVSGFLEAFPHYKPHDQINTSRIGGASRRQIYPSRTILCVVRIQVGVSVKIITGRNSSVRFRLPEAQSLPDYVRQPQRFSFFISARPVLTKNLDLVPPGVTPRARCAHEPTIAYVSTNQTRVSAHRGRLGRHVRRCRRRRGPHCPR